MKPSLVDFLKVLELYEHFQLVAATLLKEKPRQRNLEPTFDLQITIPVRLRHAIPKRILPRLICSRHHGNLQKKQGRTALAGSGRTQRIDGPGTQKVGSWWV